MPRMREPKDLECTWRFERQAYARGFSRVAGCDEAGRGALIGPVVAAAVILDPAKPVKGVDDSKKLAAPRRAQLAAEIRASAVTFQIAFVCAKDVDHLNVYQASRLAMIRAVTALDPSPQFILTDAMRLWSDPCAPEAIAPCQHLVRGDARSASIAAASILAKVARDAHMRDLDRIYPQYNLAQNKGYGTPDHMKRLNRFGPCPEHRRTFYPVSSLGLPLLSRPES